MSPPRLVLASRSPRRLALLQALGLAVEVAPADVPEAQMPDEPPEAMVARLSRAKASLVASRVGDDRLVLAADTTVELDGRLLEKPRDAAENARFVAALAGRAHRVHTGHCLMHRGRLAEAVRTTTVRFRVLDAGEVERYAASGEGLDKAGGYAIQGLGAHLVDAIDGCYTAVVGLSVPTVLRCAKRLGVDLV